MAWIVCTFECARCGADFEMGVSEDVVQGLTYPERDLCDGCLDDVAEDETNRLLGGVDDALVVG